MVKVQPQPRKPIRLPRAREESPRRVGAGEEAAAALWCLPTAAHSAASDHAGAAKANEDDVRPAFLDAVSRETFDNTNINSVSRSSKLNSNLTLTLTLTLTLITSLSLTLTPSLSLPLSLTLTRWRSASTSRSITSSAASPPPPRASCATTEGPPPLFRDPPLPPPHFPLGGSGRGCRANISLATRIDLGWIMGRLCPSRPLVCFVVPP